MPVWNVVLRIGIARRRMNCAHCEKLCKRLEKERIMNKAEKIDWLYEELIKSQKEIGLLKSRIDNLEMEIKCKADRPVKLRRERT